MPSKNHERRKEVQREFFRFHKGLERDAALEAAAGLIEPKERCIAYYRIFPGDHPPYPHYSREAQQGAVRRVVGFAGAQLISTYNEPESRYADRRNLAAAMLTCQAQNAFLVIAALGHLGPPFLPQLAASGIRFVACDKPKVNHLTIQAVAAAAQAKEKARGKRIRAAWTKKKAEGYRPKGFTPEEIRRSIETMRTQAKLIRAEIVPYVEKARRSGCRTQVEIAERLNAWGIKTPRGCAWNNKLLHQFLRTAEGPRVQISAAELMEAPAAEQHDSSRTASAPPVPAADAINAPIGPATAQSPKKKRGPPPVLRQTISAQMQAEISEGKLTAEQLVGFDEEALSARYKASRGTVREARKLALSL